MSRNSPFEAPNSMRKVSLVAVAALLSPAAVIFFGCDPQATTVLESDDAASGSSNAPPLTPDGSGWTGSNDAGGDSGQHHSCTVDADCANGVVGQGYCFYGICICKEPAFVQYGDHGGSCAESQVLHCTVGSVCSRNPAECGPEMLEDHPYRSETCLDQPAKCCAPKGSCFGPDMVCCTADRVQHEPKCVGTWLTCTADAPIPRLRSEGCQ